ncbi:MAG: DNA-binding protein [Thermoprotei archaeon]|nr:MAG: DNA-binding protein [Thermoprotei archaeon]
MVSFKRVVRKPFKACRSCKLLVPHDEEKCPNCGSTSFTEEWDGMIIIIDPEKSWVAKRLNIKKPGRYAIRLV